MWRKHWISILFTILLSACNKTGLNPSALSKYVEDPGNGLVQRSVHESIEFYLKYRPQDLVALQGFNEMPGRSAFQEAKRRCENLQFFTFEMLPLDKKLVNLIEYNDGETIDSTASYIHFNMQWDFRLCSATDTFPCVLYHLEQRGEVGTRYFVSLAFEVDQKLSEDIEVLYFDKVFGTAINRFSFSRMALDNIPSLKLN